MEICTQNQFDIQKKSVIHIYIVVHCNYTVSYSLKLEEKTGNEDKECVEIQSLKIALDRNTDLGPSRTASSSQWIHYRKKKIDFQGITYHGKRVVVNYFFKRENCLRNYQ